MNKKRWSAVLAGAAVAALSGTAAAHDRFGFSVSIGVPAPYVYSSPTAAPYVSSYSVAAPYVSSAPVVVAPAPVYYPSTAYYAAPRVVNAPAPWRFRHERRFERRREDRRW